MDLTSYVHNTKHRRRFFKSIDFCKHSKSCDLCCWEWKGRTGTTGYAQHNIYVHDIRKCISVGVHRFMFTLKYGHTDLYVLHTCDNILCVNYNHLYAGTQKDNMQDRENAGKTIRGEKHHNAKLTNSAIQQIFALREKGYTQEKIAKYFSISRAYVSQILLGKWRRQG